MSKYGSLCRIVAAGVSAVAVAACVTVVIPESTSVGVTDGHAASSGGSGASGSTGETSWGGTAVTSSGVASTSSSTGAQTSGSASSESPNATTTGGGTGATDPCGNGELDDGEECDEGDNDDHGLCTSDCLWAVCGDGYVLLGSDDPSENEECDEGDANAVDGACTPDCELRAYAVFVTSVAVTGDLVSLDPDKMSGLVGADKFCQKRAEDAGLSYWPRFKAWLSDGATSPAARFLGASTDTSGRPYALLDGTVIADDWDDLTDGTLDHPINVTELYVLNGGQGEGVIVNDGFVWSNTAAVGAASQGAGQSCADWSSESSDLTGRHGTTLPGNNDDPDDTEVGSTWSYMNSFLCSFYLRLYCFEQVELGIEP